MTEIRDSNVGIRDVALPGGGGGPSAPPPVDSFGSHRRQKSGYHIVFAPIPGLTPHGVFPGGDAFRFQCGPLNEFGESSSFNYQDYATLSGGQHSQRVGRQLRSVSFDTIFLDYSPEWALVGLPGKYPAQRAKETLLALHDAGHPFRFTVSQPMHDRAEVDYAATLRAYTWKQVAGETDAYYCSLQISEFVTPDIEVFLRGKKHHPHLPVTLEVSKLPHNRDTLHKLAKFYYGDPSKARVIAVFNHIKALPFSEKLTEKNVRRKKITVPVLKGTGGSKVSGGGGRPAVAE